MQTRPLEQPSSSLALGNAWIAPLAFVLTHMLVRRLNLNTTLYFSLQTIVTLGLQLLANSSDVVLWLWQFANEYSMWLSLFAVVVGCIMTMQRYATHAGHWWHYWRGTQTTQLHLYNARHMGRIYNYIEQNPTIFPLHKSNVHWGLPALLDVDCNKLSHALNDLRYRQWIEDAKGVAFEDTHFKVRGHLYFRQRDVNLHTTQKQDKGKDPEPEEKLKGFYMMLEVQNGPYTALQYFKAVEKWLAKSSCIVQRSYKVLRKTDNSISCSETRMFKGKRLSHDAKQKLFWQSFFHNKKQMLATRVHLMEPDQWSAFYDKGQTPTLNLLLHGPPGTGKSSFAYRIARLLDRNVVSIDLRSIDDKYELYTMLQEGCHTNGQCAKNNIYVFEEFDIAVQYLHEKQKMRQKLLSAPLWSYDSYRKSKGYKLSDDEGDDEGDDDDGSTKKKKTMSLGFSSTFSHNEFHLKDLLELLQGPVPNTGQIVIATTNHYDKIKKLCPALFRPGRLTPVYFGYFNHRTLEEFCQFYFGVAQGIPETWPNPLLISPAKLIEVAMYALQRKPQDQDPIVYFQRTVASLLV